MKQANQPATPQPAIQRRKLLGAAGTTGALAFAATWLGGRGNGPDALPQADPAANPKNGGGYRLTEHVMRYYQTTRI